MSHRDAEPSRQSDAAAAASRSPSRRTFLTASAAAAGATALAVFAASDLLDGVSGRRSGLSADQLRHTTALAFAQARTRPGHELELALEVPELAGEQQVRVMLLHVGRDGASLRGLAGTAKVALRDGQGRATLPAPMRELDDEERRQEGFLLRPALFADDADRVVLGEPVEVVVTPFVLGM